jgi:hypothetical protein
LWFLKSFLPSATYLLSLLQSGRLFLPHAPFLPERPGESEERRDATRHVKMRGERRLSEAFPRVLPALKAEAEQKATREGSPIGFFSDAK